MRDLSMVCHIGSLDVERPAKIDRKAGRSYEGNGLSISVTPDAWQRIARIGGESYILEKTDPKFADGHDKEVRSMALKWAIGEGMIESAKLWRAWHTDENGDAHFMIFLSRDEALSEVEDEEESVEEVDGYVLSEGARDYFTEDYFPATEAEDYALIWFAEAHGYDGVWWEDDYDPAGLSAPRGVIFQRKLEEWKVKKGTFRCDDFED